MNRELMMMAYTMIGGMHASAENSVLIDDQGPSTPKPKRQKYAALKDERQEAKLQSDTLKRLLRNKGRK